VCCGANNIGQLRTGKRKLDGLVESFFTLQLHTQEFQSDLQATEVSVNKHRTLDCGMQIRRFGAKA
jgi:hypothetical protein